MKLTRVNINNFRSISDITLHLEPRCRVLVGINEAGKTNILRALALLSKNNVPNADDVRVQPPHEDLSQEAQVLFVFSLDKEEKNSICEQLRKRIVAPEHQVIVHDGEVKKTLAKLCHAVKEGLYEIDLLAPSRSCKYWRFPDTHTLADDWFVPTKTCPESIKIQGRDGAVQILKSALLVHKSAVEEAHLAHLMPASIDVIHNALGKAITTHVEANLPQCVFWSHNDSHLIPAQLTLDSFKDNPSSCLPLKHAFHLAGIDNVASAIETAKKRSNGMRNLLDRVAKKATLHIREVWPEYKGIALDLRENGDNLETSVSDVHNLYDFARRSDGFKRFISFLLMVSAPTKTKTLTNVLILTDDPDAGMHPSGARHVRDELIRISESNYVVYSTHSIFMIDRERVGRHVIVTKKNEVTGIQDADESSLHDEEVLFNALGFSFADVLKKKNIVFEGWRDKELFRVALSRVPAEHNNLKCDFADWGLCHVEGVKDVRRVTPLLELAHRECIIVSDGDAPARERQAAHMREKLHGSWQRYDQLSGSDRWVTAEDFFKPEILLDAVASSTSITPALNGAQKYSITDGIPFLKTLDAWLSSNGLGSDGKKEFVETVKTHLFGKLKPGHIVPEYYVVMQALLRSSLPSQPSPSEAR